MSKEREQAEIVVYSVMDALDPTKANSNFYKEKFASMSDKDFKEFISQSFPFKFQTKLFEIEPKMKDVEKAAKLLKIPLLERVNMPYLFKNKDGVAVKSPEALVIYTHLKKMKQFITKKNSMSTDISQRDMKTGLLVSFDKNGAVSDRELESLVVMGMDSTINELLKPRADSMNSKSVMYNSINNTGTVNLKDLPNDKDDSLAKNILNSYLLGAGFNTNLINQDNMLMYTIRDKKRKVERES